MGIPIHKNRGKYSNTMTGKYFPVNKSKYKGTKPPEYKSSLEYRFMRYCD